MEIPGSAPAPFKDRKVGLIVFGILTLLAGCMCAMFVPLMILGQSMNAMHGAQPNYYAVMPAMIVYAIMAIVLIWLGVGSILARRWARALLLVGSWSALAIGVISFGAMIFVVRHIPELMRAAKQPNQPPLPAGADTFVIIVMLGTCFFFYIALPLIWVLFYRSRHVKATCEVRDPKVRWTDRCPLPLLAVSLWLIFCALTMLVVVIAFHGLFPFFGTFLVGIPGSAAGLLIAMIWAFCARAFYKQDIRGWWILVVALLALSTSGVLTYAQHDIVELYRLIGYPEEQIALIEKMNFFSRDVMVWGTIASVAPFICYLIYTRRFFSRTSTVASVT